MAEGIVCASTVTHARPPAMVIACGLPPTAIVAIGLLVVGSIRVTVPSPLLATHTEPAPTATPVGERPTAIVSVTALVPGSIRTTLSAPVTATQTPPPPTAIPLGPGPTASGVTRPVALSTRITLPAKLSVIHAAPAPTSIPPGAALGSTCSTMRPVCAASRVNSPECGATQTWSFRAATAPGLPGTTVPIVTFWSIRSNCGSMRRAETDGAVALETTTHTPPAAAAIPVGGPPAVIARSRSSVLGSTREIVWSSRFATHSDPDPNAIAPGRVPTATCPTTRLVSVSIAASELGATRTVLLVPEPASLTAAAISTASSTAAPAAITSPPRRPRRAVALSFRAVSRAGASSAGSWAKIARSSS